jgi:pimeloyl-ACP methyl ester carboxylesterase
MKLRNVLFGAAATVGTTVLANRQLRSRASGFEPFLDGEQGTYRWRGFDVSYTERGDPEDPDVLLLHGVSAAASSHEFHQIAGPLSEDHHVIAPDLPGFGHSDRPPLLYSASLYRTFVGDAIADLTDEPLVVASSLTGAYAAMEAGEVAVDRLVLVCPSDSTGSERRAWLRGLLRTPVLGESVFNLLASKGGIRYFNTDHGYYDPDAMTDAVVDYEWQAAHQPGARFAPASFAAGFLDPEDDIEDALAALKVPVTLVWGRNSDLAPLAEGRAIAEVGDTELVVFDRAKLLPHVEHPAEFLSVLRGEVAPAQ